MSSPSDLVLFTFGPIQPFIAASRRTQDLAVSSLILSSLAHAGLAHITENPDTDPIFPLPGAENWEKRLPNRLVFITADGQGKAQAEEVEKRVIARWKSIAGAVKNFLANRTSDAHWFTEWDTQVDEWLETYWVTVRWDGQDKSYQNAFQTLNLAIDARKNIRSFRTTPQPGVKGALVETLSAVGVDRQTNIWEQIRPRVSNVQLKENEKLSAIGAIKRFADQAQAPGVELDRFPSTSSIAASSFKHEILENWDHLEQPVSDFIDAVNHLGLMTFLKPEPFTKLISTSQGDRLKENLLQLDGIYFFREFFTLDKINNSRKETSGALEANRQTDEAIQKATSALKKLSNMISELSTSRHITVPAPNPYYAALVMDGDHMGKLIDSAGTLDFHKSISQVMSSTANDFQKIVEEDHPGILVYSGGDDVLALLPVTCALQVAEEIREKFQNNMDQIGLKADMSGGIAIMHCQSPLDTILEEARKAEHQAKETYGRSCLVISVLKRSGENLSAAMKWPDIIDIIPPINDLTGYFATGQISSKFVYDLRNEIEALSQNTHGLGLEINRLLTRHKSPEVIIDLESLSKQILDFRLTIPKSEPNQKRVYGILDWLLIARFIAKGER